MAKGSIDEVWDRMAADYAVVLREFSDYVYLMERGVSHLRNCSRVLDAGCGVGYASCRLGREGVEVIGLDESEMMLGYARGGLSELSPEVASRVQFMQGDVTDMPFAMGSMGGLLATNVFYFVQEPEGFISEASRVLQQGGYAVFTGPHERYDMRVLEKRCEEQFRLEGKWERLSPVLERFVGMQQQVADEGLRNPISADELSDMLLSKGRFSRIIEKDNAAYAGQCHLVYAER